MRLYRDHFTGKLIKFHRLIKRNLVNLSRALLFNNSVNSLVSCPSHIVREGFFLKIEDFFSFVALCEEHSCKKNCEVY